MLFLDAHFRCSKKAIGYHRTQDKLLYHYLSGSVSPPNRSEKKEWFQEDIPFYRHKLKNVYIGTYEERDALMKKSLNVFLCKTVVKLSTLISDASAPSIHHFRIVSKLLDAHHFFQLTQRFLISCGFCFCPYLGKNSRAKKNLILQTGDARLARKCPGNFAYAQFIITTAILTGNYFYTFVPLH